MSLQYNAPNFSNVLTLHSDRVSTKKKTKKQPSPGTKTLLQGMPGMNSFTRAEKLLSSTSHAKGCLEALGHTQGQGSGQDRRRYMGK